MMPLWKLFNKEKETVILKKQKLLQYKLWGIGCVFLIFFSWIFLNREQKKEVDYPEIIYHETSENTTLNEADDNRFVGIGEINVSKSEYVGDGIYMGDKNNQLYLPENKELYDENIHYVRRNVYSLGLSLLVPDYFEPIASPTGDFVIFHDPKMTDTFSLQFAVGRFNSTSKSINKIGVDMMQNILYGFRVYRNGRFYELLSYQPVTSDRMIEVVDGEKSVYLSDNLEGDRRQMVEQSLSVSSTTQAKKLLRWTHETVLNDLVDVDSGRQTDDVTAIINYGVLLNDATVLITTAPENYDSEFKSINRVVAESISLLQEEEQTIPNFSEEVEQDHLMYHVSKTQERYYNKDGLTAYQDSSIDVLSPFYKYKTMVYQTKGVEGQEHSFEIEKSRVFIDALTETLTGNHYMPLDDTTNLLSLNVTSESEVENSDERRIINKEIEIYPQGFLTERTVSKFDFPFPIQCEMSIIYDKKTQNIDSFLVITTNKNRQLNKELLSEWLKTVRYKSS